MNNIKLFISLAFRSEGNSSYFPDAIYDFNAKDMREYIKALKSEIIASSNGMEDIKISLIEFGIGAFNNHIVSDIEDIYALILEKFNVTKDVRVILNATPGGMNLYKFTVGRHMNNAEIILNFPSINDEDLKDKGYKTTKDEITEVFKLSYDLEYPAFSCRIDNGKYLSETISFLKKYNLKSISFNEALSQEKLKEIETDLNNYLYADGYFRKDNNTETPKDVLGVGINAISTFDNISYKNTADLNLYLRCSEDFETIAHKI